MSFYLLKLRARSQMFDKAKLDDEKRRLMAKIDEYLEKSKQLLVEIKTTQISPVPILVAFAYAYFRKNALSEVDKSIQQIVSLEPLEYDCYDRIFRLSNNVIPWYLSTGKKEEVRTLLRCIATHLRPKSASQ